jgi:hypothetical protein
MQLTRADFLRTLIAAGTAVAAGGFGLPRLGWAGLEARDAADGARAARFVRLAHGDADGVRLALGSDAALARATCPLTGETAVQAAAHMCRPDILRQLLDCGAEPSVHSASTLGLSRDLDGMLRSTPALARLPGVHGLPLLYFAAISGDLATVELVDSYAGGHGRTRALRGAAWRGHMAVAQWLVHRGADTRALDGVRRERRMLFRLGLRQSRQCAAAISP